VCGWLPPLPKWREGKKAGIGRDVAVSVGQRSPLVPTGRALVRAAEEAVTKVVVSRIST